MVVRKSPLRYMRLSGPAWKSLILLALPIVMGAVFLATPFAAQGQNSSPGSEERLQELLSERYDVLKEMYASLLLQLENGRAGYTEWRRATFALHEAEAQLYTTRVDRIKVYEKLVEAMQTQEDWARRRADAGRISTWELKEARAVTLQAQIELERVRLGHQGS